MKKIAVIVLIMILGSVVFVGCKSSRPICPAYSDVQQVEAQKSVESRV